MDETVGVGVGPAERVHHAGGGGPAPEPRLLGSRKLRGSCGHSEAEVVRLAEALTAAVTVVSELPASAQPAAPPFSPLGISPASADSAPPPAPPPPPGTAAAATGWARPRRSRCP